MKTDQMNLIRALDEMMKKAILRLSPDLGAVDVNKPFRMSGVTVLPKPILSTINNFKVRPKVKSSAMKNYRDRFGKK